MSLFFKVLSILSFESERKIDICFLSKTSLEGIKMTLLCVCEVSGCGLCHLCDGCGREIEPRILLDLELL
jgi:hypothetical protein